MILVVDDHHDTGRAVCRLLKSRGYAAYHCAHPRNALQILWSFRPSLLILDVRMPDMTGLEMLAAVRARPDLAGLDAVIYSAGDDDADRARAADLGAAAYVVKGAHGPRDLLLQVDRLLAPHSPAVPVPAQPISA